MIASAYPNSIYDNPKEIREEKFPKNSSSALCFKIFVVVAIVLAAVIICIGTLALMACNGDIAAKAICHLKTIGHLNSWVMIIGGSILFILGFLAWCCQIYKDNSESRLK